MGTQGALCSTIVTWRSCYKGVCAWTDRHWVTQATFTYIGYTARRPQNHLISPIATVNKSAHLSPQLRASSSGRRGTKWSTWASDFISFCFSQFVVFKQLLLRRPTGSCQKGEVWQGNWQKCCGPPVWRSALWSKSSLHTLVVCGLWGWSCK